MLLLISPFNLINSAKMAIRARNENIPYTVIINKVDHSNVNESFKKKVKALIPLTFGAKQKLVKNLKSLRSRFTTIF